MFRRIVHVFIFGGLTSALMLQTAAPGGSARAQAEQPQNGVKFVKRDVAEGLVAYWQFDDNQNDSLARDSSLIGANDASLVNGAAFSASIPPAMTRFDPGSLGLDGSNDRATLLDSPALNLATSFSLAVWVKRLTTGSYHAIYDSGEQSNEWWVFIAGATSGGANDNRPGFGERGIAEVYSTAAIVDTSWHHIAVVKNGNAASNLTFYLDGVASGTSSVGSATLPSGPKMIGALQDGSILAHFNGNLDELRIYNRALNAAEVLRLAQGRGCAFDGSSWAQAYSDLQCALDEYSSGSQVWVARGSYSPGTNSGSAFIHDTPAEIYGGFLGTESLLSERPAFIKPFGVFTSDEDYSILSGDVDRNDNLTTFTNYGENNRFAVRTQFNSGLVWDGFVVRSGSSKQVAAPPALPEAGGGMFFNGANGTLRNMAFLANQGQRTNQGGGLAASGATFTIEDSLFLGNAGFGGGMFAEGATVTLTRVDFRDNAATVLGGGMGLSTASLTFNGGTVENNLSAGNGGGLGFNIAGGSLSDVTIAGNTSAKGGGIYAGIGSLNLADVVLKENEAEELGGGLMFDGTISTIDRTAFYGNRGDAFGVTMLITGTAQVTVTNSIFAGNVDTAGLLDAMIDVKNADLLLANVTFASNDSDYGGLLARAHQDAQVVVRNFIVWDNAPVLFSETGNGNVIYSMFIYGRPGSGTDPQFFRNPDGGTGGFANPSGNDYGDLHLQPFSPAIDKAFSTYLPPAFTLDYDGANRFVDVVYIKNNLASPFPIDMGAYEHQEAFGGFLPLILK